jgi:aryl sulfotransferase
VFLDIPVDPEKWNDILEHCSFDYMKKHATRSVPLGGAFWDGGSETFINKGTNGRWKEVLTKEQSERYEKLCVEKLGSACSRWLNTGEW